MLYLDYKIMFSLFRKKKAVEVKDSSPAENKKVYVLIFSTKSEFLFDFVKSLGVYSDADKAQERLDEHLRLFVERMSGQVDFDYDRGTGWASAINEFADFRWNVYEKDLDQDGEDLYFIN